MALTGAAVHFALNFHVRTLLSRAEKETCVSGVKKQECPRMHVFRGLFTLPRTLNPTPGTALSVRPLLQFLPNQHKRHTHTHLGFISRAPVEALNMRPGFLEQSL